MDFRCQDVQERLPWLLNGALETDEARLVREHLTGCASCAQALAETREVFDAAAQHPTVEAILASLTTPDSLASDPAVRSHLSWCAQCQEERDMALASREQLAAVSHVTSFRRHERVASAGWRNLAIAAGLAGVLVAGGWWRSASQFGALQRDHEVLQAQQTEQQRLASAIERDKEALQRALDERTTPEPNVPVLEMIPRTSTRGGAMTLNSLRLPAQARTVVLVLAPDPAGGPERCDAVLSDAEGRVIWSGAGLLRQTSQDYTLTLPTSILQAGRHLLVLTGRPDEPVLRYSIDVRREP